MTDETETQVDVMAVQSTVDDVMSMLTDVMRMTVGETVSQVMATRLASPSKVSGGVRNGADAPATDRDRSDASDAVGAALADADASVSIRPGRCAGDEVGNAVTAPPCAGRAGLVSPIPGVRQ